MIMGNYLDRANEDTVTMSDTTDGMYHPTVVPENFEAGREGKEGRSERPRPDTQTTDV